ANGQGILVKLDEWGQKSLAYEIKKQTRGYYVLFEFCGDGSQVKELERNLNLDDRVLKYLTVCIDKDVDPEAVKAQIDAAKEKASEAAALEEIAEPEPHKEEQAVEEVAEPEPHKEESAVEEVAEAASETEAPPEETSEISTGETEDKDNTSQSNDRKEPANAQL
ncbi:MAG: 30S ribosomal protein S6, partial [Desulfobacterales bacterium S3730MH5]